MLRTCTRSEKKQRGPTQITRGLLDLTLTASSVASRVGSAPAGCGRATRSRLATGKSKYYPGKISRDRGDDTYDIDYDDVEKETCGQGPDQVVESGEGGGGGPAAGGRQGRGSLQGQEQVLSGKIRDRGDDTYDVKFDDGDRDREVPRRSIKKALAARDASGDANRGSGKDKELKSANKLAAGTRVEVRFQGRSKYYFGKILRARISGKYDIAYDDGDYRGRGKFYPGKISRDRGDDTYDIDYDDGERETRALEAPDSVQGRWRKLEARGGRQGRGALSRPREVLPWENHSDRGDGTYDISYDDGERETRVEERLIRKKDRDRSRSARAAAMIASARATRSKPIIGAAANSTRARSLEIEATIRTTSPTTTASASCASPRG